jgi:hypothetical protein
MGHEHVNASNMDVAQKGKVNEQHQNVEKQLCRVTQQHSQPQIKKRPTTL